MIETSKDRAQAHLDLLLTSARDQEISDRGAAACVAGVQTWSQQHQRDKRSASIARWTWALGGGFAVAALLLLVLPLRSQTSAPLANQTIEAPARLALAPMQVGERVALSASEGASYVVRAASEERTEIAIQSGSVTARLYHDSERDHELVLMAGDLEVRATGTIFTVGIDASGAPYSLVHEGSVVARRGEEGLAIKAGEAFPITTPGDVSIRAAAQSLVQHELLATKPGKAAPLLAPDAATVDPGDAAPNKAPAVRNTAADDPVQLWREARALRSTGQSEKAIVTLTQLAASNDATWAPLAQLELARLYDSDLSQPATSLSHARAFLQRYGKHALAPEARDLACQALAQLGRKDATLCPRP